MSMTILDATCICGTNRGDKINTHLVKIDEKPGDPCSIPKRQCTPNDENDFVTTKRPVILLNEHSNETIAKRQTSQQSILYDDDSS
ncbi:Crotonobetaine/carnitine--CoA ligase [Dirofilaria immitis]